LFLTVVDLGLWLVMGRERRASRDVSRRQQLLQPGADCSWFSDSLFIIIATLAGLRRLVTGQTAQLETAFSPSLLQQASDYADVMY